MSKGLDALERLKHFQIGNPNGCLILWDEKEEEFSLIEKELKALEIIKEKGFDVEWFLLASRKVLSQEEYELLKEVLL